MKILLAIFFTVAYFPIYFMTRQRFFDIPLHRDTGFYVSNFTVAHKKLSYACGWNARFALCGKVVPELFYSLIFLRHGGERYKWYSRFYFSLFHYATTIIVAVATYVATGESVLAFAAALILFSIVTANPYCGSYFESGEQFEVFFQAAGILAILIGLINKNVYLISIGVSSWLFSAFFIKAVSLLGVAVLEIGLWKLFPGLLFHLFLINLVWLAVYLMWVRWNGKNFFHLFTRGTGHEKYFQQMISSREFLKRLSLKARMIYFGLGGIFPVFPFLVVVGCFLLGTEYSILLVYAGVALLTFVFQTASIWYFLIPLLAPLTLIAVAGTSDFRIANVHFHIWICVLALAWHTIYFKYFRGSVMQLNRKVWRPYGTFMADQNMALEEFAAKAKERIGDSSVFVFGVTSQFYVLVCSSYESSFICGAAWLDFMFSNWQAEIAKEFARKPPEFIFSSDDFFNVDRLYQTSGLSYSLEDSAPFNFKLFRLASKPIETPSHFEKFYRTDLAVSARDRGEY